MFVQHKVRIRPMPGAFPGFQLTDQWLEIGDKLLGASLWDWLELWLYVGE